jgi:hypothetical protein
MAHDSPSPTLVACFPSFLPNKPFLPSIRELDGSCISPPSWLWMNKAKPPLVVQLAHGRHWWARKRYLPLHVTSIGWIVLVLCTPIATTDQSHQRFLEESLVLRVAQEQEQARPTDVKRPSVSPTAFPPSILQIPSFGSFNSNKLRQNSSLGWPDVQILALSLLFPKEASPIREPLGCPIPAQFYRRSPRGALGVQKEPISIPMPM